jgi:hypothetical protein
VADKLDGYADLQTVTGITTTWVLLRLPGPRREAVLRERLGAVPVPVATSHAAQGRTPAAAVWLPAGNAHGPRLRLSALGVAAHAAGCRLTADLPSIDRITETSGHDEGECAKLKPQVARGRW